MCDVTNEKQVIDTVQAIRVELGEVTMLLHCCGVPSPRASAENPIEIRSTMDIAILSHFWVSIIIIQKLKD
jgi:all-trans-retinol dehydrogenase (NAD+)